MLILVAFLKTFDIATAPLYKWTLASALVLKDYCCQMLCYVTDITYF